MGQRTQFTFSCDRCQHLTVVDEMGEAPARVAAEKRGWRRLALLSPYGAILQRYDICPTCAACIDGSRASGQHDEDPAGPPLEGASDANQEDGPRRDA